MILLTPSEALTRLVNFNSRIDRLESNEYTNKRFRTADLNKLKGEMDSIILLASIGVHNKNKERASIIVEEFKTKYRIARRIREEEIFK
jgi:hypothetical protein